MQFKLRLMTAWKLEKIEKSINNDNNKKKKNETTTATQQPTMEHTKPQFCYQISIAKRSDK